MYQILVALTVIAHFSFIGYLVAGGFLALRWPRSLWLHVPAVAWGITITAAQLDCPLTWLERWARRRAGMPPLGPDGFVAHYLTGVLYPAAWVGGVQVGIYALVAVAWLLCAGRYLRRLTRRPR